MADGRNATMDTVDKSLRLKLDEDRPIGRANQGRRCRRRRQQRREPDGRGRTRRRRVHHREHRSARRCSLNGAPNKLQIGAKLTKGLGAGADPNVGRQAALEDTEKLIEALDGADMVFVTTGLGGGTGTGAAPVIASLASELGALTIAVVTKPFKFEGRKRQLQAERGLEELRECVDTVITIPNERLLATIARTTSLTDAFASADDVLRQAIQGISDLILVPGLINLDFADVKTIMSGMGLAIMGTGLSEGEGRAMAAANAAISSPLLEDASVKGARGVIINVTGGPDLSLIEVSEASAIIQEAAHEEANIIFGAVVDPKMEGKVKITVIATGFDRPDRGKTAGGLGGGDAGRSRTSYTAWKQESGERSCRGRRFARDRSRAARCSNFPLAGAPPTPIERVSVSSDSRRRVRARVTARRAGIPATAERGVATPVRHRSRASSIGPRRLASRLGDRRLAALATANSSPDSARDTLSKSTARGIGAASVSCPRRRARSSGVIARRFDRPPHVAPAFQ